MPKFYYEELDADEATLRFRSHRLTTGPWSAGLQHGGPPNALAVAVAERCVRDVAGRDDLHALRLSSDFVGPVPVAELDVRTRIVRAARSAILVEVVIGSAGRDCLHTRVWFVRDADTSQLAAAAVAPAPPVGTEPALDTDFPYGTSIEWRLVHGGMRTLGPGIAWARPRTALLPGYTYSGLARTVLICDSASGISAELDWDRWSFVNVDLDVHLARPLDGEWLLVDAATQLGGHGSALARSTLSDLRGVAGTGLQTLVLSEIRR